MQATPATTTEKSETRTAKAVLRSYLHSPQKTRLTADVIRGKSAVEALRMLSAVERKAASMVEKVLKSAMANARERGIKDEDMRVAEIRVDGGQILYRYMPRARGRATPKRKRTSHITIILAEQD